MTTDELRTKFEEWWLREVGPLNFDFGWSNAWFAYQAAHASRDAEVEARKRDAERYREFRRAAVREDDSFIERMMLRIPDKDCTESQFDEAIDAAMRNDT